MSVEVKKATKEDKDIIGNLMQFYQYDFTDFGGDFVNERGKFFYKYLESYWEESERYPFLITTDEKISGFSFVNRHSLLGNSNAYVMAEFFILRYLRRKGIGFEAAKKIVNLFPGDWEISQTNQNIEAQKFWLEFVKSHVGMNFEKNQLEGKIVLSFNNS